MFDAHQTQVIKNCKQSVSWFLRHHGKVRHPSAGLLPFSPFKYQKYALGEFRKHKLNIFRKCRQAGISKITGAYALWFAMFNNLKTVLIVSRTDMDAMGFLSDNVVFLFKHLPEWMQEAWAPVKLNEHEIVFPNGSRIRSLTSNKDVLRSNTSSLNIIDEAAFIDNMDVLWAAGWPTLQHGGSVIVISTTNGMGGWYYSTWMDAENKQNGFNPITVNWWDMDWHIEYKDAASGLHTRIAPTDGLVKCDNRTFIEDPKYGQIFLDRDKYGDYWSPWLESQYRGLQEEGEAWKFEQEILASFVGSGNTVIDKRAINYIETTLRDPVIKVTGLQQYVHPITGEPDTIEFSSPAMDPNEGLWIWKEPVGPIPAKYRGREVVEPGRSAHSYAMGVDIATGKSRDYHAIQVFDLDTMEQVAEYMGKCLPRVFTKIVDRVGRYYNMALAVIERNNGGDTFIDEMRLGLYYPKLWRKRDIDDRPRNTAANPVRLKEYGFFTTSSSKPTLNKFLIDNLRDAPGLGYAIYSTRLHRQLGTYVRKRDRTGKDTDKTEAQDGPNNFDDLVMACGLGLIGLPDCARTGAEFLQPHIPGQGPLIHSSGKKLEDFFESGGMSLVLPVKSQSAPTQDQTIRGEIEKYALQLGGIPLTDRGMMIPVTREKRNQLDWPKKR